MNISANQVDGPRILDRQSVHKQVRYLELWSVIMGACNPWYGTLPHS